METMDTAGSVFNVSTFRKDICVFPYTYDLMLLVLNSECMKLPYTIPELRSISVNIIYSYWQWLSG